MTDILIKDGLSPSLAKPVKPGESREDRGSFSNMLKNAINEINRLQIDADQAIAKVELNKSGSIHEAMIALEKADISFRAMMQVRNKIIEAYQEVMRMQV
ncbi:MAG: flagellar hook-basal body complex protein FliE [Syntrophales bacterium]